MAYRLNASFVLGYHGCKASVAKDLLEKASLHVSRNDYDWLGHGAYFWEANPKRALSFAQEKSVRERWPVSDAPSVVGAVIEFGFCLDLTSETGIAAVSEAHARWRSDSRRTGLKLPKNGRGGLLARRDCAVIEYLHQLRNELGLPSFDTVKGLFPEGQRLYATSNFLTKTHVQIAVRNLECVKGIFRAKV